MVVHGEVVGTHTDAVGGVIGRWLVSDEFKGFLGDVTETYFTVVLGKIK